MIKYTVVGYYEESGESTVDWTEAPTPAAALRQVLFQRGDEWTCISVFEGHLVDISV